MRNRLRIAWLGQRSRSVGDGLITYSRQTVRGLRERGLEVVFFHHDPESSGDGSVRLEALRVGSRLRISPPGARRRLETELRRAGVDVVHVSISFSSLDFQLPAICARLGLPLVATVHAPFDRRRTVWGSLSQVLYRIYAPALAQYGRVIVFGASQRALLTELGVPEARIAVIPNGVDVERWSPGPSPWRSRLSGERVFTYLGRVDPEKNVGSLVEAFLAVAPRHGARLLVVGEGRERQRLMERHRDPRLVWTGLVRAPDERAAILRASDAFVLPSSIEGLSLALLEAMACGACPVATDVGCDGDAVAGAGIVLDVRSLDSDLRLAIRLLLSVPGLATELGARARSRAVEAYSLAANLDRLVALYREVAHGRHRATA